MTRKILLIDDDEDEFEVFEDALHTIDKAIKCSLAKNLNNALEYLQYNSPEYIFIDFNMPRENGLDCLSELRNLRKLENSRIILYSNYISEEMRQEAMALGAYRCIQKPSMINLLVKRLKEIV
ncbi:MAG TPA: response regulator [Chitinophagaceae bacterium]|jgi:DNA-binding NtrC family response regulator|nr:response regulator [Chitinophagaceae bacterium]